MRYTAKIVKGRGEGRRIGFPTLNFEIPPGFGDKEGVYAGWVWIGGKRYPAAIHYGPAPAFGIAQALLEAHLIETDLAEAPLSADFELQEYLREVRSFPSPQDLALAIQNDVTAAKKILGP